MLGEILFLSLGFFLCAERNAFNGRAINCGDRSARRNNRYKVSDFKLAVQQKKLKDLAKQIVNQNMKWKVQSCGHF